MARMRDWSISDSFKPYRFDSLEAVTQNREAFLEWLKSNHPKLYVIAMRSTSMEGLGQTAPAVATPSVWDKIISTVQQALPIYVQSRAQKAVLDAQLARAKQNLPPLETSQYAPTVRVETPGVERAASSVQKYLMWGAGVLGAGALVLFMMPHRRQRA